LLGIDHIEVLKDSPPYMPPGALARRWIVVEKGYPVPGDIGIRAEAYAGLGDAFGRQLVLTVADLPHPPMLSAELKASLDLLPQVLVIWSLRHHVPLLSARVLDRARLLGLKKRKYCFKPTCPSRRWQRAEQRPPPLGLGDPGVEHGHDAAVGPGTDEPAKTLLQPHGGSRDREVIEA